MANMAANCSQEHIPVPISYNLFKAHIKTAIYAEWIEQWQLQPTKYKHTRIFFPRMEPKYSKQILKLSRHDLKLLVEIITGHNNLKTFSTKIQPLTNTLCSLCNSMPETVIHLMTECPQLSNERLDLKLARFNPSLSTDEALAWSLPLTQEFCKLPQTQTLLERTPSNSQPN